MGSDKQRAMSVLMLPWLAHGHISPFLVLAKKLAKRNIRVYFCSTPVNLEPTKKKLSVEDSLSIELVEYHIPSSPDLPPHYHTTNGLPPHLMEPLKQALHDSKPNFSRLLEALKPDLVIYDFIHSWATHLASNFNIPAVQFMIFSASPLSYYLSLGLETDYPFPEIFVSDYYMAKVNAAGGEHTNLAMKRSCKIILVRSFREIEGKYVDHVNTIMDNRMVPLGPLFDDPVQGEAEEDTSDCVFSRWLDKKELSSTVYVSFGSEYFSPKEELVEIANGLELSKVNFIWVIRSPEGVRRSLEELLPDGFLERVGERGLIVEGWAPQMRILGHPSVGGFVSHCGWSSVVESMKIGMPIIAMPQHIDQPVNAKLVNALGIGLEVTRDECDKYRREEIMNVIRKVVVEEGAEEMKRKARELSQVIAKKGDEDVDEAVKQLLQICKEYGKLEIELSRVKTSYSI